MPPDPSGWPWPLNSVQEWFESLWNHIWDAAISAVKWLWTEFIKPMRDVLTLVINTAGNWIWDNVKSLFGPIAGWTKGAITAFWVGLQAFVKDPAGAFRPLTDSLVNWIWEKVRWINDHITFLGEWLAENVNKFFQTEFHGVVQGFIDGAGAFFFGIVDPLRTFIIDMFQMLGAQVSAASPITLIPTRVIPGAPTLFGGWIQDGIVNALDWVLKHLISIGEQVVGVLVSVANKVQSAIMRAFDIIANSITGAMTLGSPPKEIETAVSVMTDTAWKSQMDIINTAYKSPATDEGVKAAAGALVSSLIAAAAVGIIGATAIDLAHPLKDIGLKVTARELIYWVGIPSVTAAIMVLPAQIGVVTPLRYALYEQWQPLQPEAADLIRMAVREVFIPEELKRLKVPGPGAEFYRYMHRLGFNDFWGDAYWAAHWVRPAVAQLNEALYRDLINPEVWAKEVRLNDYVPYAIPWLQETIYSPYTRVDIRRMWDLAVVDDAEVKTNYKWLGYDEEHAQKMLLWTKAYAVSADVRAMYSKGWIDEAGARQMISEIGLPAARVDIFMKRLIKNSQAQRMESERDLTKADILRMLKIKLVDQSQAKIALKDMGYDDVEADYIISVALYQPEIDLKELTLSQIISGYQYSIYTKEQAVSKLLDGGWSRDAAETLMVIEETKLKEKKLKEEVSKEKDLAKSDVLRLLKDGLITGDDARKMLLDLGYDGTEVDYLISAATWKSEVELKELTLSQVLGAYRYGVYTREQAKAKLLEAGWSSDAVEALLVTEEVKLAERKLIQEAPKEKDLAKGDIVSLFKAGLISDVNAVEMLMSLGYDSTEAEYIVELTKLKSEVELKELTSAQIMKAYVYEIYTREEAKAKLLEGGWNPESAEVLLKFEDIKLSDAQVEKARERDLTSSEIIRGIKAEIIDVPTGHDYLAFLGYTEWEIDFLFKLNAIETA